MGTTKKCVMVVTETHRIPMDAVPFPVAELAAERINEQNSACSDNSYITEANGCVSTVTAELVSE